MLRLRIPKNLGSSRLTMQTRLTRRNMDRCGFVCPSCSFMLLLSDRRVSRIVDYFKAGAEAVSIICPECSVERSYTRSDLTLFLPGGRQINIDLRKSA